MQLSFSWIVRACAILTGAVLLSACARDPPPADHAAEPFELLSEPALLSLHAGSTAALAAQANDVNGQPIGGASLSYSSADSHLLRVNEAGEVTSLGPAGRTAVRITSGARELTVPVTISAGPAHRIEILSDSKVSLIAGAATTALLIARVLDSFGNPVGGVDLAVDSEGDAPIHLEGVSDSDGRAKIALPALTHAGRAVLEIHSIGDAPIVTAVEYQVKPASAAVFTPVDVPRDNPVAVDSELDVSLRVHDSFGNPVPNVVVRWSPAPGSGRAEPQESLSTDDGEVHTRWLLAGVKGRNASLMVASAEDPAIQLVIKLKMSAKPRSRAPGQR